MVVLLPTLVVAAIVVLVLLGLYLFLLAEAAWVERGERIEEQRVERLDQPPIGPNWRRTG